MAACAVVVVALGGEYAMIDPSIAMLEEGGGAADDIDEYYRREGGGKEGGVGWIGMMHRDVHEDAEDVRQLVAGRRESDRDGDDDGDEDEDDYGRTMTMSSSRKSAFLRVGGGWNNDANVVEDVPTSIRIDDGYGTTGTNDGRRRRGGDNNNDDGGGGGKRRKEILRKALNRARGGGLPGAIAGIVQVLSMMWVVSVLRAAGTVCHVAILYIPPISLLFLPFFGCPLPQNLIPRLMPISFSAMYNKHMDPVKRKTTKKQRTVINYQYRYGSSFTQALAALYGMGE
jgi:hypothetical protein